MPITAARRMYSPIAVRPIPSDRAITRSLDPQAYLRRRTSRTFRIDNLSAGIRPPLANRKGGPCPAQTADNVPRLTLQNKVAAFVRNQWPLSIGLGGRFPSESVSNRNAAGGSQNQLSQDQTRGTSQRLRSSTRFYYPGRIQSRGCH